MSTPDYRTVPWQSGVMAHGKGPGGQSDIGKVGGPKWSKTQNLFLLRSKFQGGDPSGSLSLCLFVLFVLTITSVPAVSLLLHFTLALLVLVLLRAVFLAPINHETKSVLPQGHCLSFFPVFLFRSIQ